MSPVLTQPLDAEIIGMSQHTNPVLSVPVPMFSFFPLVQQPGCSSTGCLCSSDTHLPVWGFGGGASEDEAAQRSAGLSGPRPHFTSVLELVGGVLSMGRGCCCSNIHQQFLDTQTSPSEYALMEETGRGNLCPCIFPPNLVLIELVEDHLFSQGPYTYLFL